MACLEDSTIVNNKVYLLFSHLLTAEEVWLCRVKGLHAPVQRLWEVYSAQKLQQILDDNHQAWRAYLDSSEDTDLEREVTYLNTKGESFTTRVDDIITHLVNHGTHHRAQIASMLQHEKVQPPVSDYIAYIREQKTVAL